MEEKKKSGSKSKTPTKNTGRTKSSTVKNASIGKKRTTTKSTEKKGDATKRTGKVQGEKIVTKKTSSSVKKVEENRESVVPVETVVQEKVEVHVVAHEQRKDREESVETILEKITFSFDKIILGGIFLNVFFLIIGIIFYSHPLLSLKTGAVVTGLCFILFGIYGIYEFFMRRLSPLFASKILVGILSIILGVFIVFYDPLKFIKLLTFSLGLYLIGLAVSKVINAIMLKNYEYDGWVITLVISILLFIFGVLMVINPMASMEIVEVTGIFIILSSILEICNLLMIFSRAKDIRELFKKSK